ncbi:pilus assembly protein [Leeia oryzae]|uniref:pilus assembly protein n=1 Tax=Leeia oryzae TaxID=356662 RepID=UPI00036AFBF4|nr:PilC/PilY family type IV pilus protein [Leeia oryzae]
MKTKFAKWSLLLTLISAGLGAHAEDTDLFVGTPNASSSSLPNVLIVIDNTANWSTAFDNEKAALKAVFDSLPANKVRVGVMLFTETGSGNPNPGGGYVRAAIRTMDSTNTALYSAFVNSLSNSNPNSDKANNRSLGLAMAEAYLYFSGGTAYGGIKAKRDYHNNSVSPNSAYSASNALYALSDNAFTTSTSTTYVSPVNASACQKNYIIYIGNATGGTVTKDSMSQNSIATSILTDGVGGDATTIPLSPSAFQDNIADEWTRFMKLSSYAITTYTIDVDAPTGGNGPANTELLRSMAEVSGGKKYAAASASNAGAEIKEALNQILSEIQSVNSVFASVSLPVSVNTQGTYLNQVYVGMFRPDEHANPRWNGNLKQYKLGFNSAKTLLQLQDADSKSAINSSTGFIAECARSFWTPSSIDTYWNFQANDQTCLSIANSANSNYPDGNIVEKGAQAYMARNNASRGLLTCGLNSCTSLTSFDTGHVSAADLGASTATEQTQLVNWAIGKDVDDDNTTDGIAPSSNTSTAQRPSIHGDVVHSRPVAINYGTNASPQVVVFYGGNDGILRAVNGNRDNAASSTANNIGSVTPGNELWAFMAPESYLNIKRLRDNSIPVKYKGSTNSSAVAKPYGMDGAVVAYTSGSNKWIYASMRRGGRSIYAFDVSTAASPSLKWRAGCPTSSLTDDTNCTTGMTGMGLSWSSPKIISASGAGTTPILVVGGGYDTCEDADPNTCTSSNKGNKVYILNADTGALLNTLTTSRGVVGDISILTDSSGNATYGYFGDLGGNVYRLNIGTSAPASWTLTQIASLGCSTTATCTANRKFMFGPDIVYEDGSYYLLLGSGDREKPLSAYTSAASVNNYFFMLKDHPEDSTWLSSENTNCSANMICMNSLTAITAGSPPTAASIATYKGWYLGLQSGEQVVTSAVTVYGTVTFSTHQPTSASSTNSCDPNLGTARVYNISYLNAASTNGSTTPYENVAGGGLPPSPVIGKVTLDDNTTEPFCIGCSGSSPLEGKKPTGGTVTSPITPKRKVYWYLEQ